MKIEGIHIYLTSITDADTENIVEWRNKDWVKSKFNYQDTFTSETHRNWIASMILSGKVVQFIIWERSSCQKIGSVYLRDIDLKN